MSKHLVAKNKNKYLVLRCREQLKIVKIWLFLPKKLSLSIKWFLSKSYYTTDMKSERSPREKKLTAPCWVHNNILKMQIFQKPPLKKSTVWYNA